MIFPSGSRKNAKAVVVNNPFPDEAKRDAAHLVVMFLKHAPSVKEVEVLRAAIAGPEIVSADGRQAYIVYPAGIGRSRLTNTLVEKKSPMRPLGARPNLPPRHIAIRKAGIQGNPAAASRKSQTVGHKECCTPT